MQDNDWITRPTAAQGAGFDAQWDPDFVQQVRAVLEQDQDADRDMRAVQAVLERRYAASAYVRVVFTESHDADGNGRTRVPTEIDPAQPDSYRAKKRSTLGGALVLTAPGVPMLFQGPQSYQKELFSDEIIFSQSNVALAAGLLARQGPAWPQGAVYQGDRALVASCLRRLVTEAQAGKAPVQRPQAQMPAARPSPSTATGSTNST